MGLSHRPLKMAPDTECVWHDHLAVPRRNRFGAVKKKAHHQSGPLQVGKLMTVVAVHLLVCALFPGGIGGIHDVAGGTEPGIILGIIIELVASKGDTDD
jgi:hypothetical protein